jgi:ABC-type multidrug transport system fused ATPase/permease subunit
MHLVRGPSWLPVRLSLYLQLACIFAGVLAMSFWCVVIGAGYLLDPDIGPNKIVVLSLIGLIIPFGLLASVLAMPIALWARRFPTPLRLVLECLPWLAVSHPLIIRLPALYHRSAADILPGRFTWLWLSITILAAVMGPITAETWVTQRARAKLNSAAARAKIAEIVAEAATRNANLQADLARNAERRRKFEERQEAFRASNDAHLEARQMLDELRTSTRSSPRWPQFLDIQRHFVQVLQTHPATSADDYRKRAEAIRQFISETDWQTPSSDLSSHRLDSLSGDVSGAAGR